MSTAFNWDEGSTTNKIMAKYMQIYYTIDMDTPSSPSALFAPTATAAEIAAALPPGSMPMYVSSVSYGMMALTCIETEFSEEQMGLALNAAYNGAVDVELEFGYTAREVLQSASIKTIVYGGSTQGLDDIEMGFEGFMEVIDASTDFTPESPGVPLVYRFRHVADNTLALVTLTSQYTLVRPLQIEQLVRVQVNRFVCTMADDEGADNSVDMNWFFVRANAFNCLNGADPGTQCNPVDQYAYNWTAADWVEMGDGSPVIHDAGGASIIIAYNTESYDFNYAKLNLHAYARDTDDGWSDDEYANGYLNLVGNSIWGEKTITLSCADFVFRAELTISPAN
ncbi:MAG: thiol-activated cytolysin family protein [bacterium]|nr:thiol-activated cytolysin family protein [bacterium]